MASDTADVDIKDGTRARSRTGGVRLEVAEPWWSRFLRSCCNLTHCTTRMQRAGFTFQKASVLTRNQSRGFILLNMGRSKISSRVQGPQCLRKRASKSENFILKSLDGLAHRGNGCLQWWDLFKDFAMTCTELVLVAASVTKLANLVHRKELANLWVPFVTSLQVAVFSLACFF